MSSAFGPRPKGALVFTYQPGRTSWEGVSEGTALRLRIEPAAPRTGEVVHFFVEAHHPDRPICSTSVLFGDGGRDDRTDTNPGTAELTHIYNRRGRYEFLYQAIVGACGDHNLYPSMYGWVDVAAGIAPATSQGPEPPTVKALEARAPGEPAGTERLQVWAEGSDPDGYIHRFVIDWGDGTPSVSAANAAYSWAGAGCKPTPSGWPGQHEGWLGQPYPEHHYATPGTYTVTVTAVSAGCDGRDEQTATITFAYHFWQTPAA